MDLKIRCCQTTQKIILVIVLAVIALAVIVNIVATLTLNYRVHTLVDNKPQIHQIETRLHTVETIVEQQNYTVELIVNNTIESRVTELESKVNYTVETEVVRIIETVKEVELNITTVEKQLNSSVTVINSTLRIVESLFINGDVDNETKLIITNMAQQVQSMGLKIDVAESNLNLIELRISNIESQNLTGKMKLGLMFDLLADVCHIHVHVSHQPGD